MSNEHFLKASRSVALSFHFPQNFDFPGVAGQLVGRFQNHGLVLELRVVHDAAEGFQPQAAFSQAFMAVFVAGKGVLAVVQVQGVQPAKAASQIAKLMQNGPTLMIAHNAQFDACFLRGLLRGQKVGRIDWLDSLTVYKDRRAYPHKLANAIIAYDLTGKVQNSHRAIDDVLALFEVLKAMDDEREDLGSYVNLFGYNPKYGVSGRRIVGVRYEPQSFSKGLTRPEQTLPARVARR